MLNQKHARRFPTAKLRALKNPRHEAFAQALARGMSASAAEENAVLIKKPEKTVKRDEMGRFEQRGTGLIKKASKKPKAGHLYQPGHTNPGPGRPKGSKNKTKLALKEAILAALDKLGGDEYLARLAVENSSAFASLLGKILPHTLAAASDSDGGAGVQMTFRRVIVWPGGREEVEGVTPKQLPAPQQESIAHQPQVGENGSN